MDVKNKLQDFSNPVRHPLVHLVQHPVVQVHHVAAVGRAGVGHHLVTLQHVEPHAVFLKLQTLYQKCTPNLHIDRWRC